MATRALHKSIHSAEQLAFRELMIAARKKAEMTQQELAKKLKKPQSFVAKYEGGERRLDVVEFVWIARSLGANPGHLLRRLLKVVDRI